LANLPKLCKLPRLRAFILVFIQAAHAENSEFDGLEDTYGNEKMLSIATGHPIPQKLSPSVTSVLTSKDIEKIGARRLQDVLEYLPGVHVSSARSGNSVIGFRGIYSETNSQVLVLVNGIPLRNTAIGGKPLAWTMPVKNISHIEVIRGPGSMLYGGDATTGVINVVLKTGKELKGGNVGSFFGSQDTYEGWAQYGQKTDDWEYSFSAQGGSTNGSRGRIERDAQSFLDNVFGTQVSNAPGFTNFGREDIDARIDVGYKGWLRLRAGYQRFNHVQTGEGGALALDNIGATKEDIYNVDLSINQRLTDDLGFESKFYFLGQDTNWDYKLLPTDTLGGLLPQGATSLANNFQGTAGLTSQVNYTGFKAHNVSLGTGIIYNWVSDVSNKINYLITPSLIQQIPFTEVSAFGNDPIQRSKNRTNFYALFQDEWSFATDFYLTTGLRYDYYSDVSAGFSPRASLVWNVNNNLTTKLLYSRSFRPPSFLEKNLPAVQGNTIKSETINTVEFQIENKWSPALTTSGNVYWFELENLITSVSDSSLTSAVSVSPNPVAFTNADKINGIGFETEGRYVLNDDLDFSVNYSYHGVSNSNQTGLLPEHMIKALINWEFSKGWVIGTQLNWIGERRRPENDPRPNLSGYFIAGLTLSTKIAKPLEFTLRANNIFGSNAKEPSLNPVLLPGDVQINERSILGQIKWSF
jgi:outer membrane receptor for ferrienterochelin and colicin